MDVYNAAELSATDLMNKEFNSDDKAYEMYVRYAKCVGFGVWKGDVTHDDSGQLIRCYFVHNRAGLRDPKHYLQIDRKREHKSKTRTNCKAKLVVFLNKSSVTWKVRKLVEDHNHDLTPLRFVHLISNHRLLTNTNKAQIDSMH